MSIYELRNVRRTFLRGNREVHAVADLDLDIEIGEMLAIEGPSGSGKTTLLQLLGGLERATSGTVRFADVDLAAASNRALTDLRLRDFGFVFQGFNLIPTLTAVENVELPMAGAGVRPPQRRRHAERLLEQVGLVDRRHHLPSNLSGGEQQRVAIGRALANDPRVLLADEPTGNLDLATSTEVMDLLADLQSQRELTIVLVTHAEHVAEKASRRIRMTDGQLVDAGPEGRTSQAERQAATRIR